MSLTSCAFLSVSLTVLMEVEIGLFHETRDRNVVMSGVSEDGLITIVYKEREDLSGESRRSVSAYLPHACIHYTVCASAVSVCVCSANRFYIKAIKGCRNKWAG